MATRVYQRPAQSQLIALKRDQAAANVDMGRHYTSCYQCSRNRTDFRNYCDAGWQPIKAVTRANAAVRRAEDKAAAAPRQEGLW